MKPSQPPPMHNVDEDAVLRAILEGTAGETGQPFFKALVKGLADALHTRGAWVSEYLGEARRLRSLAFYADGQYLDHYEYDITGTPCEVVIDKRCFVHFPERVLEMFPQDPDLSPMGVVSYMGAPLLHTDGRILGHLAVFDSRPMPEAPRCTALFHIFAARAAAEHRRLVAEAEVRLRERQLSGLVESAMDAIVKLDRDLCVVMVNPAAEKVFGRSAREMTGRKLGRFLSRESARRLETLVAQLAVSDEDQPCLWIGGGLSGVGAEGREFPAEGTLSSFQVHRDVFYTLILRNVNDRLEAEKKIRALTVETEILREELKAHHDFDDIVGRSPALLSALHDVRQVAGTDATVLLLGETGTGKELFARAIHARSRRRDAPLIKVNCAAIPATLVESELFGHVEGAFTGATRKREGRFALADGGTIFLDEVGELPLEMQSKLLRILQEGEFEPVGSSETRRVNVRVLAATNRDLEKEVEAGRFRSDLFYRLNVFPIRIPPLRERPEDIPLLSEAFAQRFARGMGRTLAPLSEDDRRRLCAYGWPGNVRELENVLERAVITAEGGRLNLERALPVEMRDEAARALSGAAADFAIRTISELQELERQNILRALEHSRWRVSGDGGAASILGMNPSTLTSRMKALGIRRPA